MEVCFLTASNTLALSNHKKHWCTGVPLLFGKLETSSGGHVGRSGEKNTSFKVWESKQTCWVFSITALAISIVDSGEFQQLPKMHTYLQNASFFYQYGICLLTCQKKWSIPLNSGAGKLCLSRCWTTTLLVPVHWPCSLGKLKSSNIWQGSGSQSLL